MERWAECLDALARASAATEALADALEYLLSHELDSCDGRHVMEDANNVEWSLRLHLAVLFGPAPPQVHEMRNAIENAKAS